MWSSEDDAGGVVFRDVILLALLGFMAATLLLLPFVNPPREAEAEEVTVAGDLVFESVWPAGVDVDVDQWVWVPGDSKPVGYSNKGGVRCNLLRDDLGLIQDPLPVNTEITFCRGFEPGTHVMNLHAYRARHSIAEGLEVLVKISRRAGDGTLYPLIVARGRLDTQGQEITVARFDLDPRGHLVGGSVSDEFTPLRSAP